MEKISNKPIKPDQGSEGKSRGMLWNIANAGDFERVDGPIRPVCAPGAGEICEPS